MKNLSLFPNHCSEKNASESDILGVTNDTDDARIAKIDECQMLQKRICIGLSIGKILINSSDCSVSNKFSFFPVSK